MNKYHESYLEIFNTELQFGEVEVWSARGVCYCTVTYAEHVSKWVALNTRVSRHSGQGCPVRDVDYVPCNTSILQINIYIYIFFWGVNTKCLENLKYQRNIIYLIDNKKWHSDLCVWRRRRIRLNMVPIEYSDLKLMVVMFSHICYINLNKN